MALLFESLEVYRNAVVPADAVLRRTECLPRSCGVLVDPLNRATLSIAAKRADDDGRFPRQFHRPMSPTRP